MQSSIQIDTSVQERRNTNALAMKLRLSCTDPSKYICRSVLYAISNYTEPCCDGTRLFPLPLGIFSILKVVACRSRTKYIILYTCMYKQRKSINKTSVYGFLSKMHLTCISVDFRHDADCCTGRFNGSRWRFNIVYKTYNALTLWVFIPVIHIPRAWI